MPRCTRCWTRPRLGYAEEIATAREGRCLTVEGKSLNADLKGKGMSFDDFWEDADYAVIEDAYRRASRILSPDLCRTYAELPGSQEDRRGFP